MRAAHRFRIATLLGVLSAPLAAQSLDGDGAGAAPILPSAGASSAPARPALAARVRALQHDVALGSPAPSWSGVSVVEVPVDNGPMPHRRHHAISIPFDGARSAARSFGVEATDCALQLRMPARVTRDAVAGARAAVTFQAQVRLACRM